MKSDDLIMKSNMNIELSVFQGKNNDKFNFRMKFHRHRERKTSPDNIYRYYD